MLQETRKALRIVSTAFDDEILELINAGVKDIELVGAVFDVTQTTGDVIITDPLAKRAVITYVKCNFGSPDNYEQLKSSYDEQKAQLRANSDYMRAANG